MFLVTNENMGLCLYMVGIQSTVGKRAKRMPDTTVETTLVVVNFFWSNSNQFSVILIRSSELASNKN